jgi:hypothetical protein
MNVRIFSKPVFLLFLLLSVSAVKAQTNFFTEVSSSQARIAAPAVQNIQKYRLYELKTNDLRTYLAKAPVEFSANTRPLQLAVPLPNGTVETFALAESSVLAPAVAAAHPDIKTYTGQGQTHPGYTIRLSMTSSGFDAIILGVDNDAVYYTKASDDAADRLYMTYFARDARATQDKKAQPFGTFGKCGSVSAPIDTKGYPEPNKGARAASPENNTGKTLKTFRLAIAATGEFTQQKGGGNVGKAFNALVTYVNRMNAVYRAELSVSFVLVSDTTLVFPDPKTDPYTNTNQSKMLTENQETLTKLLGSAKYDVGHVFGTAGGSGGGIASTPSVCDDDLKGRGVSGVGDGSFAPIFDDHLINHEVGHQFGMNHSFNSSIPVCTTREAKTSVEPGSGTTIMSYGYTCSSKTANDDYEDTYQPFLNLHTANYDEAITFIGTISCFTSTTLANSLPVIRSFPPNLTIPKSTPFSLSATAFDADTTNTLTYSWEGTNVGLVVPDSATFADTKQPPFFRSYTPVSSGSRTFPRLEAILNGTNYARGDKLPSVGIVTTIRLTVRDNVGGSTYRTDTLTIDDKSGPFLETTNLSGTIRADTSRIITWDVANTTALPVSCTSVNILLSTDGGKTFPITLLANTPNDGNESVRFPVLSAKAARIKVAASNSIFFDISNKNFSIIDPNNLPPTASEASNLTLTADVPISFTLPAGTDPEKLPLIYTATGLPASLSLNPETGVLSGIPRVIGVYSVSVIVSDQASETATTRFTITIFPARAIPMSVTLIANPTVFLATAKTSLTAIVSGGRPPYNYDFNGPADVGSQENVGTFTNVTAGVQALSVTVIDTTLPVNQTITAVLSVTVNAPSSGRISTEQETTWRMLVLGNPTGNDLTVLISGAEGTPLDVSLLDVSGRVIKNRRIQPITMQHQEVIDISAQPAGLFILQATDDKRRQSLKVIKQ